MDLTELLKGFYFCKGKVICSGNKKSVSPKDIDFEKSFDDGDEVFIINITKQKKVKQ